MPSKPSVLGSQAVYSAATNTQTIVVNASTCHNLSLFKDLMKEYRKLDDSVNMRLNRTGAQFRDRDRSGLGTNAKSNVDDEACAYFWKELIANWKRRTEIIEYCVDVVDQSIGQKRETIERNELSLDAERSLVSASYAEEVKRNQIHNELTVESIVRQRSLNAFKSRCRLFEPAQSDTEARRWWDAASRGR